MNVTARDGAEGGVGNKATVPRPVLSLAILLVGSILVGLSMGSWLAPPAAWLGPVLIMRFARDHSVGRGFLLVLAACTLSFAIGFIAIWRSAGWPPVFVVSLPVMYGLVWSLPYLADRLLSRRLPGFSSTLVYPLAAASLEFVNTSINPVGAWGATGFTQYGELPLMQLASVTGMIGITFLMGWFASTANWAWERRGRGGEPWRGLVLFGTVLALVLAFGFLRLNLAAQSDTIRVAGITADPTRNMAEPMRQAPDAAASRVVIQDHWDAYFDATAREAKAGAQLVLWPEISGVVFEADEASFIAQAQDVARQQAIYLAVPFWIWNEETKVPVQNKLLVFDPGGSIVIEHLKYGGTIVENTEVGDGVLRTATTPFGVLSGVICWDADYPAVIQQAGQNGTALLLVPASDWAEIDPLHTQMAVFRAVENGHSLVRQAEGNVSVAVDSYGRVLAGTDFFDATDRTIVAQVPVEDVPTLYASFGRWLGWVCLVGFLLLAGYVVARGLTARRSQ
jgi:apolipoprotein N-acyltransferase